MTPTRTVRQIATLLATEDRADFLAACAIVANIDDDEEFDLVKKRFPGMVNYDAKGNWIGEVRNENGWTP